MIAGLRQDMLRVALLFRRTVCGMGIAKIRPYFICGCGHSGTTIIANILAGHTEVYCPLQETGIFLQGSMRARWGYCRLILDAANNGKSVLLEKTPRHIHHLELLRALVPEAKLIIPVRDGRDVAASIAARLGGDLSAGINRWIADNSVVLTQQRRPDVYIIRYEHFVERPAQIMAAVCNFMGIRFYQQVLQHHTSPRNWFGEEKLAKAPSPANHEAYRNWQVNQPIFDGRGRWRNQYTEDDMKELLTRDPGRALMRTFGYLDEPTGFECS